MRHFVLLLVVVILSSPNTRGQTFVAATQPAEKKFVSYSTLSFKQHRERARIGAVGIVGVSAITAGCLCVVGGFAEELTAGNDMNNYTYVQYNNGAQAAQNEMNIGETLVIVGAILLVAGIGMTIGGAIHDHSRFHRERKLGIISPKKNEVGVAYNFK